MQKNEEIYTVSCYELKGPSRCSQNTRIVEGMRKYNNELKKDFIHTERKIKKNSITIMDNKLIQYFFIENI